MFVGRETELDILEEIYNSRKSELVVLYGRRRIGKSKLISRFTEGKSGVFTFEAIEGEQTPVQLNNFTELLKHQVKDPLLLSLSFSSWEHIFNYITERIITKKRKKKLILFFDEIQWMAAGRNKLISLLKYYWDNKWKQKNLMLILCGSIASFMVQKVIQSKALYGRITCEILLKGLKPDEAASFFYAKRTKEEILKYLLIFGSVPKYLEEIDNNKSFNQNMNRLCFSSSGIMVREIDRIFYSQFKEFYTYRRIVSLLKEKIYTFDDISKKLHIASGGGLKQYLDNLERAEIIRSYIPFGRKQTSKFKKYSLADEYLLFYFKYIEPNLRIINENGAKKKFEMLTSASLETWFGFAFERFCIKHASYLAKIMGFEDEMLFAGPYFEKKGDWFQIDLLYEQSDKVITICEIKHQNKEINSKIIPEIEKKCSFFSIPRGYTLHTALISLYGPDISLRNSEYFNHIVTINDIFKYDKS